MRKANPKGWNTVRVIAIARAVSIFGDELAVFSLLLREKHNGGGALGIAAIMAAGQLPLIFLSPWAGMLADRVPVRRLTPVVNIIQAVLAAMLAFNGPLILSLGLICLIGVGAAINPAAWNATLPEIIDKEELPRAMSMLQAWYALAGMAGPAAAGILVAKFGYVTPMITNAVTFALLALMPMFLTLPFHARERGSRTKGDIWVGLQVVRKEPVIRALAMLGFSLNLSVGMLTVAELFFTLDNLHASTFIYGLVGSTFAAFTLVAALFNKRRDVSEDKLPMNIIIGAEITGLAIILNGIAWNWVVLFPAMALAGAGVSTVNAYYMALMLQRSPEASRARVLSAVSGVTTAGQMSSLAIGGVLVSIVNPRFVILVIGTVCLLTAVLLSSSLLRASRSPRSEDIDLVLPAIDSPMVEPE
jgi:MFS family permease